MSDPREWDFNSDNYILVPHPDDPRSQLRVHKSQMPEWRKSYYEMLKAKAAEGGQEEVRELAVFMADNLDEPDFEALLEEED